MNRADVLGRKPRKSLKEDSDSDDFMMDDGDFDDAAMRKSLKSWHSITALTSSGRC
jgi:hypothetical protein